METIYSGKEKRLHYKLVKQLIKEKKIKPADIAQIYFGGTMPNDKFPLWTLTITIYRAGQMYNTELVKDLYNVELVKEVVFIKENVRHNFYITWANLKHYSW